jgi:hypothetical protein
MMLISATTNSKWTNFSPTDQFKDAIKESTESKAIKQFKKQLMNDNGIRLLRKKSLSKTDFQNFLEERFNCFVELFNDDYDIRTSSTVHDLEEDIDEEA